MTPHFKIDEFLTSQTAVRLGLDNTPPERARINLGRLANELERVRARTRAPIIITSGYRSPAVNAAVGGAVASAHMEGRAADIICPGYGTPYDLAQLLAVWRESHFDQVILEFGRWVHVAIPVVGPPGTPWPEPKREALTIRRPGGSYEFGIWPVR